MRRGPRSLYAKIFLWFCLTAVVATALVFAAAGLTGSQPFGRRWMAMTQDLYAHSAVDFYATGGPPALADYLATIDRSSSIEGHLLRPDGGDVLGAAFPDHVRGVFERARATGHSVGRLGRFWTAASPVAGPHGERYIFVMEARPLRGFLDGTFFVSIAARLLGGLLLVALFCLLLARHITQPVRLLQLAATRMAGGDLTVRTLPGMPRRHDELAVMAAAFDSMAERIETLLDTQRQMLADISHELRSPLTRISVSLELLRRGESDVLESMQADLDRLNLMISQVLELTRFELQPQTAALYPVDLRAILEDLVESAGYEGRAEAKTVALSAPQGACMVLGEDETLRSCLENIIRNAVQYSPVGGQIDVVIEAPDTAAPAHVAIRVDDAGPGVPEAFLAELFRPFFRLPANAAQHPHGTGLGLSISSRIAARYGGTLTASQRLPSGLSVRLVLPAQPVPTR